MHLNSVFSGNHSRECPEKNPPLNKATSCQCQVQIRGGKAGCKFAFLNVKECSTLKGGSMACKSTDLRIGSPKSVCKICREPHVPFMKVIVYIIYIRLAMLFQFTNIRL